MIARPHSEHAPRRFGPCRLELGRGQHRRGDSLRVDPRPRGCAPPAGAWPYSASGLLAPGWAVLLLVLLWELLEVVAWRVHRRWGAVSTVVPLLALGLWFGVHVLREQAFGWTA